MVQVVLEVNNEKQKGNILTEVLKPLSGIVRIFQSSAYEFMTFLFSLEPIQRSSCPLMPRVQTQLLLT